MTPQATVEATLQPSQTEARERGATLALEKASEMLGVLAQSGVVERGGAAVISLQPIKLSLGAKWQLRRSGIIEHAERALRRHLSSGVIWFPVNDTQVLIAGPGCEAGVVQGACFRTLKEVLTHFLGELDLDSIRVDQVDGLSAQGILTSPLSLASLQLAERQVSQPAPEAAAPTQAVSQTDALKAWPLQTMDGRELAVSFAIDPVVALDQVQVAGHRIEARLLDAPSRCELPGELRRRLLPRDTGRMDLAALERGLLRIESQKASTRPWLILQLSFASLSNGQTRRQLFDRASKVQDRLKQSLICELVDLDDGLPAGRLREIASLVKPMCNAVFAQVPPTSASIEMVRAAKLAGLTVRAADLGGDAVDVVHAMRRFGQAAAGAAPVLTVTTLPCPELILQAKAAGFTHATLRAGAATD